MTNTITKEDSKKEQIRKAAQRCFTRYGFNKTTMDDIAAAIGMKKASLYYYYKNKEAIFSEVIEEDMGRLTKTAEEKLSQMATATDKLFCFIKTKLEFFREKASFLDLSVQVIIEMKPIIDKLHKEFRKRDIDFIAAIIREGIHSGEFKDCDPHQVADAIQALVDSLSFKELQSAKVQSAADIDYTKLENKVEYILNIFIYGIKA